MDYWWSLFSVLDFRLCLALTAKINYRAALAVVSIDHYPCCSSWRKLIKESTVLSYIYIYISCLWDKINIFKSFRKEVNMRIIALMGDALPFKSLLNAIIYLIKKSKKKKKLNILKYYCNLKFIFFFVNTFETTYSFNSRAKFSASFIPGFTPHNPPEIILICRFGSKSISYYYLSYFNASLLNK